MLARSYIALVAAAFATSATALVARAPSCTCDRDINHDEGALINEFPSYQCAYAEGSCVWISATGELLTIAQSNCADVRPLPASDPVCLVDLTGSEGSFINEFTSFQCAYPSGSCIWDQSGSLLNIDQGNCERAVQGC